MQYNNDYGYFHSPLWTWPCSVVEGMLYAGYTVDFLKVSFIRVTVENKHREL